MHKVIEDHLCLQRTARDVIRMAPLSVDIETMKKDAAVASEKKDGADDASYEGDANDDKSTQVKISSKDPLTPAKKTHQHQTEGSSLSSVMTEQKSDRTGCQSKQSSS